MDNSVKKLPAGEVKKRLLEGQLTFDSLDERRFCGCLIMKPIFL